MTDEQLLQMKPLCEELTAAIQVRKGLSAEYSVLNKQIDEVDDRLEEARKDVKLKTEAVIKAMEEFTL